MVLHDNMSQQQLYKVLYDFKAEEEGELTVFAGNLVRSVSIKSTDQGENIGNTIISNEMRFLLTTLPN